MREATRYGIKIWIRRLPLLILLLCCGLTGWTQKVKSYSEDLSVNRPRFEVNSDSVRRKIIIDTTRREIKPQKYINAKVDAVLDSIDRFNLTKRFVEGFTMQVYAGQKQEDAMNAKQLVMTETPDLIAILTYVQPKFRVTVGAYLSTLEAQKDMMRLKHAFPNAILVPEKILIK